MKEVVKTLVDQRKLHKVAVWWVYYVPRRRVVASREASQVTLGIGSKVCYDNVCWHHLYIDVDKPVPLDELLRRCRARFRGKPWTVWKTRKGWHIHVYFPFRWKDVLSELTRWKDVCDVKWLNIQRKRGFVVIRVDGKYWPCDIRLIHFEPSGIEWLDKYACFWIVLFEEIRRGRLIPCIKR